MRRDLVLPGPAEHLMLIGISKRAATPPKDAVDLLLECHARIRRFVAMAHAAATHEEADPSDIADACSQVRRYFSEALPLHIADEELSILPRLEGTSEEVDAALAAMDEQHRRHEPLLARLLELVEAVGQKPSDARQKEQLARTALELEQEFAEHLTLEETVLFPALRAQPADLQTAVLEEIRARRARHLFSPQEARLHPEPKSRP